MGDLWVEEVQEMGGLWKISQQLLAFIECCTYIVVVDEDEERIEEELGGLWK